MIPKVGWAPLDVTQVVALWWVFIGGWKAWVSLTSVPKALVLAFSWASLSSCLSSYHSVTRLPHDASRAPQNLIHSTCYASAAVPLSRPSVTIRKTTQGPEFWRALSINGHCHITLPLPTQHRWHSETCHHQRPIQQQGRQHDSAHNATGTSFPRQHQGQSLPPQLQKMTDEKT